MLQAPATPAAKAQRLRDIALMCCTVTLFAALDTTAKYLTNVSELPVTQVIWARFVMHVPFAIAAVGPALFLAALRANRPGLQWLRATFLFVTTACNFAALIWLQLDQTVTIFFLAPLLIAALAGPLLGEWAGWRRLLAICTGFIGVIFVLRPGFGGVHWAILLSFGAAITYALYNIATRYPAMTAGGRRLPIRRSLASSAWRRSRFISGNGRRMPSPGCCCFRSASGAGWATGC